MSRYYGMSVAIKGSTPSKQEKIIEAASSEWVFEDFNWLAEPKILMGQGNEFLYGGESEEEFADRLAKAIWKANGKYCEVIVTATNLENPPTEQYRLGKKEYEKLMRKKRSK